MGGWRRGAGVGSQGLAYSRHHSQVWPLRCPQPLSGFVFPTPRVVACACMRPARGRAPARLAACAKAKACFVSPSSLSPSEAASLLAACPLPVACLRCRVARTHTGRREARGRLGAAALGSKGLAGLTAASCRQRRARASWRQYSTTLPRVFTGACACTSPCACRAMGLGGLLVVACGGRPDC